MKTQLKIFSLFILCFLLTACGFHPRCFVAPPPLNHLYVETPHCFDTFTQKLKTQLQTMCIELAAHPCDTPLHLVINEINYTHSNPNIISSNFATTYAYTLTVTLNLIWNHHDVVPAHSFSASGTLTLNPNQVLVPGSDFVIRQELQRQVITQIYYWLSSENVLCHLP